ncbi:hypothetical protein [Acinetobacter baumannii]|uniref:hypothetical protein n=1 Tax=Acinetobacter baumannii TaxID=470 RepID=UPI0022227981|nr:hypothetical protein [Acinetobacter baumannii]MCW1893151.1 hypothetical protein [Acinetobacter baumannii]
MFGKVFFLLLVGLACLAFIASFYGGGKLFLAVGILLFLAGVLVWKIFKVSFNGY